MEYKPYQYPKARYDLAVALMLAGAVLTKESSHPLVVTRGSERGFRLKLHETSPDAPLSPFYINLRTPPAGPLTPHLVETVTRCMQYLVSEKRIIFDGVAGVPRAGDPFAKEFARLTGKPLIVLDKWEHGGKRRIIPPQDRIPLNVGKVLMIDDLITRADSKVEAINIMRDEGKAVSDIAVLIDREQGGREELAFLNCTLHSVFTISELLDLYAGAGQMKPALHNEIKTYLAAA